MIFRIAADALIVILSGGIVVIHLVLFVGLIRVTVSQRKTARLQGASPASAAAVSIVVPARNEEENLPRLLASLDRQTARGFQLVLVNDRSTDRTQHIMEEYAARCPGNVELVGLTEQNVMTGVNPKQNALAHGAKRCSGEILLFTDSDCELPRGWVEETTAHYSNSKLGLLIGAITTRSNGGFVTRFHAFDHIFKYGYTAGSAGIGMATGGFGNNLSIRRVTLEEIGGFESLGYSTTEDAALIAAVRTRTRWKVGALISKESLVMTTPFTSLRAVADQEVRWHIGGLFSTDLSTKLSYGYLMLFLTASVVALPFIPLVPELALLPVTSFVTMAAMALAAGGLTRRPFRTFWLWFLPDLCFTILFNSYLTIRALVRPRVTWKGRRL